MPQSVCKRTLETEVNNIYFPEKGIFPSVICWSVQWCQSYQLIDLVLGFAEALGSCTSTPASNVWGTPEISSCFRVLLAFQIGDDLSPVHAAVCFVSHWWVPFSIQFHPWLSVPQEYFLHSAFLHWPLGDLCISLGQGSRCLRGILFYFLQPSSSFSNLSQPVTTIDEGSKCVPEGFPTAFLYSPVIDLL